VFSKSRVVRKDLESIMNRQVVLLQVTVDGAMEVVLINNVSIQHDPDSPHPLPRNLAGYINHQPPQPEPMTHPFAKQIVDIDVPNIVSMRLLRNTISKHIDGVSFCNHDGEIAQAIFHKPIECKDESKQPIFAQYLIAGVFTTDLKLVSKFLGHKGASAKIFCIFCLAVKAQLKNVFLHRGQCQEITARTIAAMSEDGTLYKQKMSELPKSMQKKKRPVITQGSTHSMVLVPAAKFCLGCITKSLMHAMLGMVSWIVKCINRNGGIRFWAGKK